MIGAIAARDPRQPFAVERSDVLPERGAAHEPVQARMGGRNVFANGPQLGCLGHVEPAADPDPFRGHLEIQTGAAIAAERLRRKMRGDVGLERRLVRAEARVAIDAVKGDFRIGHEVRRERRKIAGEPIEQLDHRPANVPRVVLFPVAEPLAVVVALERPEERESPRRKR